MRPVSYTHLDVYKRQEQGIPVLFYALQLVYRYAMQWIYLVCDILHAVLMVSLQLPVADVYKRQM